MRSTALALCLAFAAAGMTAPTAFAKHHAGEAPETHRQNGKGSSKVAKPAKKGADDPKNHDAKDDKGQGGKGKDDRAGHH